MPEEELQLKNAEESQQKSTFFAVAVTECLLAAGIMIAALILKFCFADIFYAARQWYRENAAADTDVIEIINGAENEVQTV